MITGTNGVFKAEELPELEPGQSRYIMAAAGLYYEQNDDLFHASTSIHKFYREVNFGTMLLLKQDEFFIPKFPRIPEALLSQCLGFFRRVEDQHDCECGLVLLYDPDKMEYQWCCPEQEISSFDLKFTTPIPGKDYPEHLLHFGDVHLHPRMSAYHSSTDVGDEMTASDGLHLVVGTPVAYGKWNSKTFKYDHKEQEVEFSAVFVSDGARFNVQPESVMELTTEPGLFPRDWMDKLTKKVFKQWTGGTKSSDHKSGSYSGYDNY